MIPRSLGDVAMRQVIDEMRLMRHPAKEWEQQHKFGFISAIRKYMSPSPEVVKEALDEVDALRRDQPARPYQRIPAAPVSA